ncbi:MAG: PHP domain-containing protein [Candidatus Aminicenantes bacterium]|nr:PHP domain-containing protein [Candidatus Aminicenantes bacterium]
MLKRIKADFHIHTCLSPCADLEMSPQNIASQAKTENIDLLGICDHNSAENVSALKKAANKFKIQVLPGIEVTTQEEIHILALFNKTSSAFELQEIIYQNLPGENDEETFGMQVVVNEKGEVLHFNKHLLIGATSLSLEKTVHLIHSLDGLAIAAHIDRPTFSIISQLGFIPDSIEIDALEISPLTSISEAKKRYPSKLPMVCFSDSHFLKEIGNGTTFFYIETSSIQEIKKAFLNQEGRKIVH